MSALHTSFIMVGCLLSGLGNEVWISKSRQPEDQRHKHKPSSEELNGDNKDAYVPDYKITNLDYKTTGQFYHIYLLLGNGQGYT